jgi:acetyl-CoA acyltransferase
MGRKVYVVGVGMIKFERPGKRDWDYPKMGRVAGKKALADAGISYQEVQQAVVGYVYGKVFKIPSICQSGLMYVI